MKYYKDELNEVYIDPIVSNHTGLIEITKEEFEAIIAPTQSELTAQANSIFINKIDATIAGEVSILNATLGVLYRDIHSCKSYAMSGGYEFQAECIAITDWAFLTVWPIMRAWKATLTSIPTDAEFQTELDKIPFNG